jgi:hypothetical protein
LALRIQGSGFRVQGSGFRVQGSGFRVKYIKGPAGGWVYKRQGINAACAKKICEGAKYKIYKNFVSCNI